MGWITDTKQDSLKFQYFGEESESVKSLEVQDHRKSI